jgi:hypothetical protein
MLGDRISTGIYSSNYGDNMFGFIQRLMGAKARTEAHLQSIGDQAWARLRVANAYLNGKALNIGDDGSVIIYTEGGLTAAFCLFFNKADALAFQSRLDIQRGRGQQILNLVRYNENTDYYQLSGWGIEYPPRCNVQYFDWVNGEAQIVIDLGAIRAET